MTTGMVVFTTSRWYQKTCMLRINHAQCDLLSCPILKHAYRLQMSELTITCYVILHAIQNKECKESTAFAKNTTAILTDYNQHHNSNSTTYILTCTCRHM